LRSKGQNREKAENAHRRNRMAPHPARN